MTSDSDTPPWWVSLPPCKEFHVADEAGRPRRILRGQRFAVELLRHARASQYGKIMIGAAMSQTSDGVLHRTTRTVVVKRYDKRLVMAGFGQLSKSRIQENVCEELALWQHLSSPSGHANVAPLLSTCHDDKYIYAVTSFAALGDSFDFCHSHGFRIDADLARSLCAQAAAAVAFVHSRFVAHRDISLENFVMDKLPSGAPLLQLIDFGLAARLDLGPRAGATVLSSRSGKVAYMAPELFAACDATLYDPYAADVWSLGCAFFILLTGAQPYDLPVTSFAPAGQEARFLRDCPDPHAIVPRTTFDLIAMGRIRDAMRVCHASEPLIEAVAPLLHAMLSLDPTARPTAAEVAAHPWVQTAPLPDELLALGGVDEEGRETVPSDKQPPYRDAESPNSSFKSASPQVLRKLVGEGDRCAINVHGEGVCASHGDSTGSATVSDSHPTGSGRRQPLHPLTTTAPQDTTPSGLRMPPQHRPVESAHIFRPPTHTGPQASVNYAVHSSEHTDLAQEGRPASVEVRGDDPFS